MCHGNFSGAPPASHAKQAAASAYMVIRGNHPVDTSIKPTYIGKQKYSKWRWTKRTLKLPWSSWVTLKGLEGHIYMLTGRCCVKRIVFWFPLGQNHHSSNLRCSCIPKRCIIILWQPEKIAKNIVTILFFFGGDMLVHTVHVFGVFRCIRIPSRMQTQTRSRGREPRPSYNKPPVPAGGGGKPCKKRIAIHDLEVNVNMIIYIVYK